MVRAQTVPELDPRTFPIEPILRQAVRRALERGTTVVSAALSDGRWGLGFPASVPAVIAVLGADAQGRVDPGPAARRAQILVAPGTDIISTTPGGNYDFLSGSSLAAAHVTGIVALLLERDPALTPGRVQAILLETARPLSPSLPAGADPSRLVDACAAVASLLGATCPNGN